LRALAAIVAVHFVAVELVKRWFYRRMYRATN
jgi:hypothetical protein